MTEIETAVVPVEPRVLEAIAHNLCSLHDFDVAFVMANERFARAVITEYVRAARPVSHEQDQLGSFSPKSENTQPATADSADQRLTKDQAAIIGAFTGYLAGPFSDMHAYVERLMERPVFTHEMASKDFAEELRNLAKRDFLAIVHEADQ